MRWCCRLAAQQTTESRSKVTVLKVRPGPADCAADCAAAARLSPTLHTTNWQNIYLTLLKCYIHSRIVCTDITTAVIWLPPWWRLRDCVEIVAAVCPVCWDCGRLFVRCALVRPVLLWAATASQAGTGQPDCATENSYAVRGAALPRSQTTFRPTWQLSINDKWYGLYILKRTYLFSLLSMRPTPDLVGQLHKNHGSMDFLINFAILCWWKLKLFRYVHQNSRQSKIIVIGIASPFSPYLYQCWLLLAVVELHNDKWLSRITVHMSNCSSGGLVI